MKLYKWGLAVLTVALLLLSACGNKKDPEAQFKELFTSLSYLTEEMYDRATSFPEGDLTRIADVMRRAEAGEKITIGVIGGSITQGSSATRPENNYASLLKKWWEENFPEAEIELINAGVGGTTSYLGVHRVEEDLLSKEPDLVVVEFSVNDANTNFYQKSYDNLIYRILTEDNAPALVLLFMTMDNGTSAQVNDSMLGFQYGIPMLSYGNAVLDEIKAGSFTWKDISPDNIHPNDRGHAIVGELFSVLFGDIHNRLDEIPKEKAAFDHAIVTKTAYLEATILNTQKIEPIEWGSFTAADVDSRFPGNWVTETGEESIVFEVEAANIGIMYRKMINGTGGQYEVYVDGVNVMTLDADFSGGWGNYQETTEVFADPNGSRQLHRLEIKKKEGSTGDAFALLGLLIS